MAILHTILDRLNYYHEHKNEKTDLSLINGELYAPKIWIGQMTSPELAALLADLSEDLGSLQEEIDDLKQTVRWIAAFADGEHFNREKVLQFIKSKHSGIAWW